MSAQILLFQFLDHVGVALLALPQTAGLKVGVARFQIGFADEGVSRLPVRGKLQMQDDTRRDVVVFADEGRAVGAGAEVTVPEAAESGQLRAVVRLAAVAADGGGDEAKAQELLLEAGGELFIGAEIEGTLGIPGNPLLLEYFAVLLADGKRKLADHGRG